MKTNILLSVLDEFMLGCDRSAPEEFHKNNINSGADAPSSDVANTAMDTIDDEFCKSPILMHPCILQCAGTCYFGTGG